MATRIYFRNTQTHPGARTLTFPYRDALRAVGNSVQNLTAGTADQVNGERQFYYLSAPGTSFISERVETEFTLSGSISVVWLSAYATGANILRHRAKLYKVTHGGSDVLTLIGQADAPTALNTTNETHTTTITPASPITIARNERFVLRMFVVPADGSQTFGSDVSEVQAFNSNSTTSGYAEFIDTFTFRDNGVKLYLRRSADNGIGSFLDMLETRGAVTAYGVVPTTPAGTSIPMTRQPIPLFTEESAAEINDTANVASYVSPSFTPVAGRLYLLGVVHSDAATEATVPTVSSTTGLTFVQVGSSVPFNTIAANVNRLTLFRALKNSGLSAGTYTVTFGDAGTGCLTTMVSVENVLTTGTDGADAVRNIVTGSANAGANPSITLGALLAAHHSTIGFFGTDIATAPTAGTTVTLLDTKNQATPTSGLFVVYDWFNTSTVLNATLAASDWGGVGLEVVPATDSTQLEWISPRLAEGFVAHDAVNFPVPGAIWAMEDPATANAGLKMELFKRAPDGTETLIYTKNDGVEVVATSFSQKVFNGGTLNNETAVNEDDRLVLRATVVNVGVMAAGRVGVSYDGPLVNQNGDSSVVILDGPDFKDEADPARTGIVPSGGSLMGLSNGQ